jgi:hypothetical protein
MIFCAENLLAVSSTPTGPSLVDSRKSQSLYDIFIVDSRNCRVPPPTPHVGNSGVQADADHEFRHLRLRVPRYSIQRNR